MLPCRQNERKKEDKIRFSLKNNNLKGRECTNLRILKLKAHLHIQFKRPILQKASVFFRIESFYFL
jgi:hypothetical protein